MTANGVTRRQGVTIPAPININVINTFSLFSSIGNAQIPATPGVERGNTSRASGHYTTKLIASTLFSEFQAPSSHETQRVPRDFRFSGNGEDFPALQRARRPLVDPLVIGYFDGGKHATAKVAIEFFPCSSRSHRFHRSFFDYKTRPTGRVAGETAAAREGEGARADDYRSG